MISSRLLHILRIVFVLFFAFLGSIYFTGNVEREYNVVEPNETVLFKNQPSNIENLAEHYLPEMYILKELQDIKPEEVYYEVIDRDRNFSIVYRVIYSTETVPSFLLNSIYSAYRTLFYGSKKDIEFVQFDINKETGAINRVLFETSSTSSKSLLQIHKLTEIIKYNDGYLMKIREESQYLEDLHLNDTHLQIVVVTWNHLFSVFNNKTDYIKIGTIPLSFLDKEEYKDYKMARRSAGDFKSRENYEMFILFFLLSTLGVGILKLRGLL